MNNAISGFSKLSKDEKINWIASEYFSNPQQAISLLESYWNTDENIQKLHDEFIENTITNFYVPFGVAPNFIINGKPYTIPMAIEESSVVLQLPNRRNSGLREVDLKRPFSIQKKLDKFILSILAIRTN